MLRYVVLLSVHLSIILVINQLDAQNLFYNMFIIFSTCSDHYCVHNQEDKIVLYGI